ncbi:MAG: hypothetical protein AABZ08_04430 [Planctomycetota bacterium]
MVFVTTTIWLAVAILLAWGVLSIWSGMTQPKTLNVALLPGTLAASLGRIVALLITGATLPEPQKNTPGKPPSPAPEPQPKMKVVGPILVALIPMLLLGGMLYVVVARLGGPVVSHVPADPLPKELPITLAAFWSQIRGLVTLCEKTLDAVLAAEASPYRVALFVYLMICLTVRLAPGPGNLKGHLLAVAAMGGAAILGGTLTPLIEEKVVALWPLLCLVVAWLMLLLFGSLIAKAVITSARSIIKWD